MIISYGAGRLRIDYNEIGFTKGDVEALCRVGRSTKSKSGNQIGEKGIGFKSVFKIADVVSISSGYYSFKFDKRTSNLGMITPEWEEFPEPHSRFTSIMLQISKDYDQEELIQEMKTMDPRYLMFLKRLQKIYIVISKPDVPVWKTTLSRAEEKENDGRHRITLGHGDRQMPYLVCKHIAKSLPPEPKRNRGSESPILLAFPITNTQEAIIEPQQVYAFLPIRDYGFKFLIHADFLLAANRKGIDSSSLWNWALREAILVAFVEEVQKFSSTPLRYTWPQYIPDKSSPFDFFWKFRSDVVDSLRKSPIVESEDGQLRIPTAVTHVPKNLRDETGIPLALCTATAHKYLSHEYSESDVLHLINIGLSSLPEAEFLDDLKASFQTCSAFRSKHSSRFEKWHSNVANVLISLISKFETQIADLPLVRLKNGLWIPASSGTIFFPRDKTDFHVPEGIEVFEVDEAIRDHPDCERLYTNLQVKSFSITAVQDLILKKHANQSPSPKPSQSELISQAVFLFKSKWKYTGNPTDTVQFWVTTRGGEMRRSWEVYVDTDQPHSAYRYLGGNKSRFPFLPKSYYRGISAEELPEWIHWLHKHLGMWVIPRLVRIPSNNTDLELSEEFVHIIENAPSRQFLNLLKENWSTYSPHFANIEHTASQTVKHVHTILQTQVASIPVTCRDEKQHALETTSTGYFLPDDFSSEYFFLQPILNIPEPQDHRWKFLKTFGVTVDDDLNTYLTILVRIQSHEVSRGLVQWLYNKIQGKFDDNRTYGRDLRFMDCSELFMQNNCIYIPSSSSNVAPRWVALIHCVWEGPKCLTQHHRLSSIYPDYGILFKGHLEVKDAGLEVLIEEAKAIIPSTPLSLITDIFKELSKSIPETIPTESRSTLRAILTLQIFPLDEGGESVTGFDQLSSATSESEWYIADRIHLQKCFHGQVSLLAFTVEEVAMMERLILALDLQHRLLSKIAVKTPRIDGEVRDKDADGVYRSKVEFIGRLMPGSIPLREKILFQLKNLEVWKAEKLFLGWGVERIDPISGKGFQEGYFDDDGLLALVIPSAEAKGLKIYLKDDQIPSFPPLELAEQLAAFCGVPEHESLMLFILSQESQSQINNTLDRRGILSVEERQKELEKEGGKDPLTTAAQEGVAKQQDLENPHNLATDNQFRDINAPGRNGRERWIGVDDNHQEEEDLKMITGSDDEDSDFGASQPKPSSRESNNRASQSANNASSQNEAIEHKDAPVKPTKQLRDSLPQREFKNQISPKGRIPSRPNYLPLENAPKMREYVRARAERSTRKRQTKSTVEANGLGMFERPRIVDPTVIWVPNSQELPAENFSDRALERIVFPGRAQISSSGDCTIYLAKEPSKMIDTYTEFLGELFVSKLLEKYLGKSYNPDTHWTSHYRHQACHAPLGAGEKPTSTFKLYDGSAMTEFLIQSGSEWKWKGKGKTYPHYHILVKTTNGAQESLFDMSQDEMEMIRRYRVSSYEPSLEVVILVRVFDMQSTASASFFVDPWSLYAAGMMQIHTQNDSYVAEVRDITPHLHFKGFKIGEHDNERKYKYKPLGENRSIRLLRLLRGRNQDGLRGKLEHVSLDSVKDKNTFKALSYVWGNPLKPFLVDVGDSDTVRITAALFFALKRLRKEKSSVKLWADGICIDQENDEEKNHQVRLMPDIYKSAQRVYAWLGNEEDRSDLAIDCLLDINERSQSSKQPAKPLLPSEDSLAWDAIVKFFGRSWFRRVWVVQELVLPRSIIMLCGDRRCHWDEIYVPANLCATEANEPSVAQIVAPILSLGRLRIAYHSREDVFERELLSLFKAFEHTGASRCRDKLYAFLGLACDSDDPDFYADYAAPLEAVVQKYAGVFVRRGKGLELLYHAGVSDSTSSTRFPSWIPNWVTTTYPRTISTWQSNSGPFTAGLNNGEDIQVLPGSSGILSTMAYIVDEIVEVGQISFAGSDEMKYFKGIFSILERISSYPTGENPRDIPWKVPIGDARYLPDKRQKEVDFRISYQALREYMQRGNQTTDQSTEIIKIRALAKLKQYFFRHEELTRLMWEYFLTAREFAGRFVNAKVCITSKGYVGIVPGRARVGSLITVFHGSVVPFIVEKTNDLDYYRLIGEGYIHGIMHKDSSGLQGLHPEPVHLC
ncbi:hypothetical protein K505DRAFT_298205 [Melanomma pulvis-pyrius CBS 109.77]|uniref:Uncharacterized protein n=1 Tax=Melanomma pulvis-pyrius CBS 109.77 TaxID=1314802 RepID=A0A6A6XMU8_9PLEO|nr:hypothetical protein K505DRAFT_298205 [Melanomma pulvis-pyrius CBS 109.77]